MKTTRIDVTEVCKAYNSAREKNAGRKGGTQWVTEILHKEGLSGNMVKRMMREPTLFIPCKRENAGKGNHKGFIFPLIPIHISWFENWLSKKETPKVSIEKNFDETECVEYLRKQGYKLRKCIGFDEDTFKKDYPQLYEKYLIYEEV